MAVLAGICDGFIGNRMIAVLFARSRIPAGGGRVARAGRPGDGEVWLCDGTVRRGRPRRQRCRLTRFASAASVPADDVSRPFASALFEAGRLGQKTGKGFYRYEGRTRIPIRRSWTLIEGVSRRSRHHASRDPRRGDLVAPVVSARQRRREDRRRRHRYQGQRHRHRLRQRLRIPGLQGRPDVLGRAVRFRQGDCDHAEASSDTWPALEARRTVGASGSLGEGLERHRKVRLTHTTGSRVVYFFVRSTKLVLTERTALICSMCVDRKCSYASMLAATIRSR